MKWTVGRVRAWLSGPYLLEGAAHALTAIQVVAGHLCKVKTLASGRGSQVIDQSLIHPRWPRHSLSSQVLRGPA